MVSDRYYLQVASEDLGSVRAYISCKYLLDKNQELTRNRGINPGYQVSVVRPCWNQRAFRVGSGTLGKSNFSYPVLNVSWVMGSFVFFVHLRCPKIENWSGAFSDFYTLYMSSSDFNIVDIICCIWRDFGCGLTINHFINKFYSFRSTVLEIVGLILLFGLAFAFRNLPFK